MQIDMYETLCSPVVATLQSNPLVRFRALYSWDAVPIICEAFSSVPTTHRHLHVMSLISGSNARCVVLQELLKLMQRVTLGLNSQVDRDWSIEPDAVQDGSLYPYICLGLFEGTAPVSLARHASPLRKHALHTDFCEGQADIVCTLACSHYATLREPSGS